MYDLDNLSLLDSNGVPYIEAGDRLVRIENIMGEIEWAFPDPPGMWCSKVEPAGYGLEASPQFNLVYFHFKKDRQGGT
jgi:hypothetical protein